MTIIISTGRITFHDFTCLVFQGDISGPLVYLGETVIVDTLLVSPGSTNTYAGLQNTLTSLSLSAQSNDDTKSEAQTHSLIFLNQNYELTSSSGEKFACNNFVI